MVSLILLIAAVILFAFAAVGGVPSAPRFNFTAAGLACFALSFVLLGRLP